MALQRRRILPKSHNKITHITALLILQCFFIGQLVWAQPADSMLAILRPIEQIQSGLDIEEQAFVELFREEVREFRYRVLESTVIGVPKEIKPEENRVGLTPTGVRLLKEAGVENIVVQAGAGKGAGFEDDDYKKAGAKVIRSAGEVWKLSNLVIKVKEPLEVEGVENEFDFIRSDHTIFTYFHLASEENKSLTARLMESEVGAAVAYETVEVDERTALLDPMSEVAGIVGGYWGGFYWNHLKDLLRQKAGNRQIYGKLGSLIRKKGSDRVSQLDEARQQMPGFYPDVPAGDLGWSLKGAKAATLGGGMAGFNSAVMLAKMGAQVTITEKNVNTRKLLRRKFKDLNLKITVADSENKANVAKILAKSDIIVGAVYVKGEEAPKVIDEELLEQISKDKRKLIIDISVDQGGCIWGSTPSTKYDNPVRVDKFGNARFCVANMPAVVPRQASIALERAKLKYALALACGVEVAASEIYTELVGGINIYRGALTCEGAAKKHSLEYENPIPLIASVAPHIIDRSTWQDIYFRSFRGDRDARREDSPFFGLADEDLSYLAELVSLRRPEFMRPLALMRFLGAIHGRAITEGEAEDFLGPAYMSDMPESNVGRIKREIVQFLSVSEGKRDQIGALQEHLGAKGTDLSVPEVSRVARSLRDQRIIRITEDRVREERDLCVLVEQEPEPPTPGRRDRAHSIDHRTIADADHQATIDAVYKDLFRSADKRYRQHMVHVTNRVAQGTDFPREADRRAGEAVDTANQLLDDLIAFERQASGGRPDEKIIRVLERLKFVLRNLIDHKYDAWRNDYTKSGKCELWFLPRELMGDDRVKRILGKYGFTEEGVEKANPLPSHASDRGIKVVEGENTTESALRLIHELGAFIGFNPEANEVIEEKLRVLTSASAPTTTGTWASRRSAIFRLSSSLTSSSLRQHVIDRISAYSTPGKRPSNLLAQLEERDRASSSHDEAAKTAPPTHPAMNPNNDYYGEHGYLALRLEPILLERYPELRQNGILEVRAYFLMWSNLGPGFFIKELTRVNPNINRDYATRIYTMAKLIFMYDHRLEALSPEVWDIIKQHLDTPGTALEETTEAICRADENIDPDTAAAILGSADELLRLAQEGERDAARVEAEARGEVVEPSAEELSGIDTAGSTAAAPRWSGPELWDDVVTASSKDVRPPVAPTAP